MQEFKIEDILNSLKEQYEYECKNWKINLKMSFEKCENEVFIGDC